MLSFLYSATVYHKFFHPTFLTYVYVLLFLPFASHLYDRLLRIKQLIKEASKADTNVKYTSIFLPILALHRSVHQSTTYVRWTTQSYTNKNLSHVGISNTFYVPVPAKYFYYKGQYWFDHVSIFEPDLLQI